VVVLLIPGFPSSPGLFRPSRLVGRRSVCESLGCDWVAEPARSVAWRKRTNYPPPRWTQHEMRLWCISFGRMPSFVSQALQVGRHVGLR
jgi:hypothetical protein